MIVVDASVMSNAIADDGVDGEIARARLLQADVLVAPDLLDIEVLSVLRKSWLARRLTSERLADAVDDLIELPIERVPMRAFVARADELRANVTPYDGVYVALAESIGCPLVTADGRLARASGPRCKIELIQRD